MSQSAEGSDSSFLLISETFFAPLPDWRVAHEIRRLMEEGGEPFTGTVEADETYIGGKRAGKRGRGAAGKTPVIGIAQRRGGVRAKVVENVTAASVTSHIRQNVVVTTQVITDELPVYNYVPKFGFTHDKVNHGDGEYVNGRIHTNTIEGFWSQVKRSIDGTYHHVSRQHLQNYVNEFSFRYNNRFFSIWAILVARLGLQLSATV